MTRVYIEMYIETPYFAENLGDIFVAFRGEKGDVSWSKAITSPTSPSSVIPVVQVADSYTWSFQACTSFTMSIKKKLIYKQLNKQPCRSFSVHVRAWLVDFSRCRRSFSTTNATLFRAWLLNFEITQ